MLVNARKKKKVLFSKQKGRGGRRFRPGLVASKGKGGKEGVAFRPTERELSREEGMFLNPIGGGKEGKKEWSFARRREEKGTRGRRGGSGSGPTSFDSFNKRRGKKKAKSFLAREKG